MNKANSQFYALPILIGVLFISACSQPSPTAEISSDPLPPAEDAASASSDEIPADDPKTPQPAATGWQLEMVAQDLEIPWSIVFPSENRILVSERTGAVREIADGNLKPEPVYIFDEVRSQDEAGLMSLALHPDYESNAYLYACYTTSGSGANIITRVARLVDNQETLTFDRIILDNIPAARFHAGCRIQFGPDGMLYVSTGDALDTTLPQDISSLAGKILRIDPEGNIPTDNPFPDSPVYSFGHRNPQGFDWDESNLRMYATEHGPSGFDGPPGGDEINLILPGENYGWPLGSHDNVPEDTIGPLIQFTPAEAPGSALFYDDDALPFFSGSLFFGALRGEGLVRVTFTETGDRQVVVGTVEKIIDDVGRVRDVAAGPDGSIYFTTSNRDGRGTLRDGDDKLYRLVPVYD